MLSVISSTLRLPRSDTTSWSETDRKNPHTPVSFFIHDGKNLNIIEGFAGDSHAHIGFPYSTDDEIAFGRVNRQGHSGSANTHPDILTSEIFSRVAADVVAEYGIRDFRWEWQGDWYTTQELLQTLEAYENSYAKKPF